MLHQRFSLITLINGLILKYVYYCYNIKGLDSKKIS